MDALSPPRLPVAIFVLGALTIVCATRLRDPRYELRGANEWYGTMLAADKNQVVTVDRESDRFVVRFDRIDNGTAITESRVVIAEGEVVSVDIRGETAAAYVRASHSEVRFFDRANDRWSETQRITLPAECVDERSWFWTEVHLGDDLAVAVGTDSLCVFERRGRWLLTDTLPSNGLVRVSGKRIFAMDLWNLDQIVRDGTSWTRTTLVSLPEGLIMFANFDASDRWLMLRVAETLLVYDLDHHFDLAHIISLGRYEGRDLAIGNRALAYTIVDGARAWCFDDEWHDCGTLDGAFSSQHAHPVAIGDVLWLGAPRYSGEPGEPGEPGRVLGYELP